MTQQPERLKATEFTVIPKQVCGCWWPMAWTDVASALQAAEVCHCKCWVYVWEKDARHRDEEWEDLAWERASQLKTWWWSLGSLEGNVL